MSIFRVFFVLCTVIIISACSGRHSGENLMNSNVASIPVDDGKVCERATGKGNVGLPSEEKIYNWIADLVDIGYRRTGTIAGYAASAYVKCEFEKLGLQEVHYEYADSWKWEATKTSVQIAEEKIDAFPSSFSFVTPDQESTFSTGPDGLEAVVVDVGAGLPVKKQLANVKGKIVLFDLKFTMTNADIMHLSQFTWDPNKTLDEKTLAVANPYVTTYERVLNAAMKAGAVGFIGVLADYFDSNQYYNEYYRRTEVSIPGFWVSAKEGARVRALLARSEAEPTAKIVLEGSRSIAKGRSVFGYLPGKSKETIMVQSHHDSVFSGAVEDGSGTAAVLAQAQYFAAQPLESRERTLMFATFDTHFTGYQSHMAFTDKYLVKKDTPYSIVANVTLEHIGKQGIIGDDGDLVVTELPEMRGILNTFGAPLRDTTIKAVVDHDLQRTVLLSAHDMCSKYGMPTDASFVCLSGIPTVSLITGPNYLYDAADTLDKVDRAQLVPVTKAFIDIIEAIDITPAGQIGQAKKPKDSVDVLNR
jgi:hypothetical protein